MPIKLFRWFSDIRFLAILFVLEVFTLRLLSIQIYMPLRKSDLVLDLLISTAPSLTKSFVITAVAGLAFFFAIENHQNAGTWQKSRFLPRDCWLHSVGFIGLCLILILLRRVGTENLELASRSLLVLTLPLWLGMVISWSLFFASFEVWRGILERQFLGLIFIFTISLFSFFTYDAEIAAKLGVLLLEPTITLTNGLLAFAGKSLVFVGQSRNGFPLFRLQSFVAEIQPACSGYEGVLLTLVFLAVLLWRERYNAPLYVLLSVLGFASLMTFLLNSVRIAILFLVGAFLSPEVAQNGFHTRVRTHKVVGIGAAA